jgi:hypothetical protein
MRWIRAQFAHSQHLAPRTSRFSRDDVCTHDGEVIAGSLERLLGVMLGDQASVVVQSEISLPSETVEDRDATGVLLVAARPHEIDDCDVVDWLTPIAEAMAEHPTQRGFEHRFVRLLKASLLVEGEDLMARSELLLGTCNQAFYLRSVNRVWLELLHGAPTSKTRLLCPTFSR